MRPFAVAALVLLAACGSKKNNNTTQCNGSLTFSTDIALSQSQFTMCSDVFGSGDSAFDTDSDAQGGAKTQVSFVALGLSANSTVMCDAAGAVHFIVNEPTYVDYHKSVATLQTSSALGGPCTVTTTTYDINHWSATAEGTLVDTRCTSDTSCPMETHKFSAQWSLGN